MSTALDHTGDYSFDEGPIRPGVRIGSYQVEGLLGSGGMGSVFAARHIGLDKPVVIKSLHRVFAVRTESVQRFVREGRAASKIRHPHVVDVTDVGAHEGIPYLVMEHLEGQDLEKYLEARGTLEPAEIVRIMLPVLDAVATAHEAGVVHRDLKPSNIFLAQGQRGEVIPKVLDFGIAKILDTEGPDRMTLTRHGSFVGTPYYASPEQAKSGSSADARSDQYSIGAILYELASSRTPVEGRTPFEVLGGIVAGEAVPFSTLRSDWNPMLVHAVERALAYDPANRFASVRELGVALMPLAEPEIAARWRRVFGAPEVPSPRPALSDLAYAATMLPGSLSPVTGPLGTALLPASEAEPASPEATHPERRGMLPTRVPAAASPSASQASLDGLTPSFTSPSLPPATPRSRAPLVLSGLALALVLLGLGGFLLVGPLRGVWEREPETPPLAAPPPARVVSTSPPDAVVEVDGVLRGRGTVRLPQDGRPHRVRVSAVGHVPRELEVAADGTGLPELVELAPEPDIAPVAVVEPPVVEPTVVEPAVVEPAVVEPAPEQPAVAPALAPPVVSSRAERRGTAPRTLYPGPTQGGSRTGAYGGGGGGRFGGAARRIGGVAPAGPRLGNNNAPVLR